MVPWKKDRRRESFVLFSISGFTNRLTELAKEHSDLLLIGEDGKIVFDKHD
jgi:hypothetical protein